MLAAVGHRQPADEVGQPDVGGASSAPGSRAGSSRAPTPRRRSRGRTCSSRTRSWKTMKFASRISSIRRQRLEAVQVVLGRLALDVARLVREQRARGVDALAARLEHRGDRVLREPVDLEVGVQPAQLVGDRDVAPRVAEPDRRRDVQRALAAATGRAPSGRRAAAARRSRAASRFTFTGSRACGAWPEPSSADQRAAGQLRERGARRVRADRVVERRGSRAPGSGRARASSPRGPPRRAPAPSCGRDQRLRRRLEPQPTQSSICLVECGSVKICEKKNSRKSA